MALNIEQLERKLESLEFDLKELAKAKRPVNPFEDIVVQLALESGATVSARTRYLWLHPEDFDNLTGTVGIGIKGTWPTGVSIWDFGGGGSLNGITSVVALPSDWVSGVVTFTAYYQGDAANTDNRRIELEASALTPGTDSELKAVDLTVVATVAHGNNLLTEYTFLSGLTVAAGDLIRLAFSRDSGHGDDTNTDSMHFLGVRLEYTAFF
jgi:hypothetical protein